MNSLNKSSEILLSEMTSEDIIRKELDDVTLYFDYQETDSETELSLITISKNHGERFLFHKISSNSKPRILIANTIKGKGISFMENNNVWHHNRLTQNFYDQAISELQDLI